MFLHYIGHAGWLFEDGGNTILCDPWKTQCGAFYGSWFPFPANDHVALPDKVDAIYLSHAHQDHFSPETLARFSLSTPIVIADFKDPILAERLAACGFTDVRLLADGEREIIGSLSIEIFRDEDCGIYHDSAALLKSVNASVLNLNDCRLSETWLPRLGNIDVLLGQFSGANWYPLVYEYAPQEKSRLGAAKRSRGLNRLLRYSSMCHARYTVPCAGPPAFLDSTLWYANDFRNSSDNPFPTMATAVEFLKPHGRATLAMPGDILECRGGDLHLRVRYLPVQDVYGDMETYVKTYADKKMLFIQNYLAALNPDPGVAHKLVRELNRVVETSRELAPKVNSVVHFQLTGLDDEHILWDCKRGARVISKTPEDNMANYHFVVDHRLISDLLKNKWINFEDLFLSMRFKARRSPDLYDDALFSLLVNFDAERLRLAEDNTKYTAATDASEMFELHHKGKTYAIQRRCPHMGGDLSLVGQVDDGIVTCTRHGWQFRLSDGRCLNVAAASITVHQITQDNSQPSHEV